jgi:hypothetical protein
MVTVRKHGLNNPKSAVFPHSIFVCAIQFLKSAVIIVPNSINRQVFVVEIYVFSVRWEYIFKYYFEMNSRLKMIQTVTVSFS